MILNRLYLLFSTSKIHRLMVIFLYEQNTIFDEFSIKSYQLGIIRIVYFYRTHRSSSSSCTLADENVVNEIIETP